MDFEKLLIKHYENYPNDQNVKDWSGCNYYINQGNHEMEPIGTATSMHDCGGCEKISYCLLKQATPVWEWSEEIEKDLKMKTLMMNSGIQ